MFRQSESEVAAEHPELCSSFVSKSLVCAIDVATTDWTTGGSARTVSVALEVTCACRIVACDQTRPMPTTFADAIWMLDLIVALGGFPIVAGGWGVDALLGVETRSHRDLDVLVDHAFVSAAIDALSEAGFVVTTDWLPVRIELSDAHNDRHYDHGGGCWQHGPSDARFDYPAGVLVAGEIGGRPVRCLSAAKQIELHTGYDRRDVDHHDLARLATLAPMPSH